MAKLTKLDGALELIKSYRDPNERWIGHRLTKSDINALANLIEFLRNQLRATMEVVEAAKESRNHSDLCPCNLCKALKRYEEVNDE